MLSQAATTSLVHVEKVQHKHAFEFKRSVKMVQQVVFFGGRTGGAHIFSVCRRIPAKCVSSVFSSQCCYLSGGSFLCIVKLLGFKQYAVCIICKCQSQTMTNLMIVSSVEATWLYAAFEQCMPKMKVLTSIFPLDYKHMLHWVWPLVGKQIMFSKLGLSSPYSQEIILNSGFKVRFLFEINVQRKQRNANV